MNNRIVRCLCYFTNKPSNQISNKLNKISDKLKTLGFEIQTLRICSPQKDLANFQGAVKNDEILRCIGSISSDQALEMLSDFHQDAETSFNINLSTTKINNEHTKILFEIIRNNPSLTFNFAYVFNNPPSSPFFPSANYKKDGFSIGLQPTDLSENCTSLEEWLVKMKEIWNSLFEMFGKEPDFLGIDSSIAPIFEGKGSLINFVKRLGMSFNQSASTDIYLKITDFIKNNNPRPVGLCGLMFPCLEDFELADEYERGNFSIERNVYLSLHSGLGIDTYPIGTDEKPEKVTEILSLIQGLSNKFKKPLSVRFVSDGKAKVGEKTNFENQYLKDVTVRSL